LKQAKEEAEEEINKYRAERERQFKEFEAKVKYCALIALQIYMKRSESKGSV